MSNEGGDPATEYRQYWGDDWLDEAFAILADGRRRFVLAYLRDYGETTLLNLANVVAGWERTRTENAIASRADRDRVAARLHHVDLPKLAASGLVRYVERSGRVELLNLRAPIGDLLAAATGERYSNDKNHEHSTRNHRR